MDEGCRIRRVEHFRVSTRSFRALKSSRNFSIKCNLLSIRLEWQSSFRHYRFSKEFRGCSTRHSRVLSMIIIFDALRSKVPGAYSALLVIGFGRQRRDRPIVWNTNCLNVHVYHVQIKTQTASNPSRLFYFKIHGKIWDYLESLNLFDKSIIILKHCDIQYQSIVLWAQLGLFFIDLSILPACSFAFGALIMRALGDYFPRSRIMFNVINNIFVSILFLRNELSPVMRSPRPDTASRRSLARTSNGWHRR